MTRRILLTTVLLPLLWGCQVTQVVQEKPTLRLKKIAPPPTLDTTGELPPNPQPASSPIPPARPLTEYQLRLSNFIGDETYTGGASQFVFWELEQPAEYNVTRRKKEKIFLAYSPDGGSTWLGRQEASFDANRSLWRLPKVAGSHYRVKVWIERSGQIAAAAESRGDFAIATGVATARLDVAPTTRTGKADISYTTVPAPGAATFVRPDGTTGPHDPVEAIVWYTGDNGKSWRKYESYAADGKRISFGGEDGVYGLYMSFVDDEGLASPAPLPGTEPMARLLIDTTRPQVEVSTQLSKGDHPGLLVTWKLTEKNLANKPVTLFLSDDNGKSWRVAARDIKHSGTHRLPIDRPGKAYRVAIAVKDLAGNITRKEATHGVIVDNSPPVTVVIGPTASNSSEVQLRYVIRDTGGSGVQKTTLYYSRNEGITWEKYKTFEHGEAITFVESDGAYGLYLASEDWAGNEEPRPRDGTVPQIMLTLQNAPPEISVKIMSIMDPKTKSIRKGKFKGGTIVTVVWEGKGGFMDDLPVRLEYFDGAGWNPMEGQYPRLGSTPWTLPRINSKRCKVRARIANRHGASASAQTAGYFSIDSSIPQVRIGAITQRPPRADRTVAGGGTDTGVTLVTAVQSVGGTAQPADTAKPRGTAAKSDASKPADDATPEPAEKPLPKIEPVTVALLLEQAQEQIRLGKPHLAEQLLLQARQMEPDNVEVLAGIGHVLFRQKRYAEAEKLYEKLLKLDASQADAHYMLGLIYFDRPAPTATKRRKNMDKAKFHFVLAIKLDENHHRARNMLGMVFFRRKKVAEALEQFDGAIHHSGGVAIYHFNRAVALSHMGRHKECIESAQHARRFDRNLKATLWYMAKSYTALGDTEAAISYWERTVLAYGTNTAWGSRALAQLNALKGEDEEADHEADK